MSKKQKSNWKPLPPRFIPFDRRAMSADEVVTHIVRYKAVQVMQADRKAGLPWTSQEGAAAFRYLKQLTHGEQPGYLGLKFHQLWALQAIFAYTCYFEERRSLARSQDCLPGMTEEWYADLIDNVAKHGMRILRRTSQEDPNKRCNNNVALHVALDEWYVAEHLPEVALRLAEEAEAAATLAEAELPDNVILLPLQAG